jgi:hypothetical protein
MKLLKTISINEETAFNEAQIEAFFSSSSYIEPSGSDYIQNEKGMKVRGKLQSDPDCASRLYASVSQQLIDSKYDSPEERRCLSVLGFMHFHKFTTPNDKLRDKVNESFGQYFKGIEKEFIGEFAQLDAFTLIVSLLTTENQAILFQEIKSAIDEWSNSAEGENELLRLPFYLIAQGSQEQGALALKPIQEWLDDSEARKLVADQLQMFPNQTILAKYNLFSA